MDDHRAMNQVRAVPVGGSMTVFREEGEVGMWHVRRIEDGKGGSGICGEDPSEAILALASLEGRVIE